MTYQEYPKWVEKAGSPDMLATSATDEMRLAVLGYKPKGKPDAEAYDHLLAVPDDDNYEYQEYPRWENGVLIEDPNAPKPDTGKYPKHMGDAIVNSEEEELAYLERKGARIVENRHFETRIEDHSSGGFGMLPQSAGRKSHAQRK